MFDKTPLQPDPQWVVPVPLLSDDKLTDLFMGTCADSEYDHEYRQHAKRFAAKFTEFGKDWKWYYSAYWKLRYGN